MKKLLVRSLVISLLAFLLANSVALAQSPPGPTIASAASASVGNISGEFDVVNAILDFAPGAAMPSHSHGGHAVVTVLQGEITNAFEGQPAKIFRAGESWVENPEDSAMHSNASNANARVSVAFLLPKGAELTIPSDGTGTGTPPPGPSIVSAAQASVGNISGEYDLINAILDFAPGAAMPSHTHGGLTLVTVLEGELTNAFEGQAAKAFRAGESWVEQPGELALHRAGASGARASVVFLLPKGAELTTMVGEGGPGMPRTGAGDVGFPFQVLLLPLLVLVAGLLTRIPVRR